MDEPVADVAEVVSGAAVAQPMDAGQLDTGPPRVGGDGGETLLPAQFFHRVKTDPFARLSMEVLVGAVEEYLSTKQTKRALRYAQMAEDWFLGYPGAPLSFAFACEVAGVDADYLLRGLKEARERKGLPVMLTRRKIMGELRIVGKTISEPREPRLRRRS